MARRTHVQPLGNPSQRHRCLPPQACGNADLSPPPCDGPAGPAPPTLAASTLPEQCARPWPGRTAGCPPPCASGWLARSPGPTVLAGTPRCPRPAGRLLLAGPFGSPTRFHSPGKLPPPCRRLPRDVPLPKQAIHTQPPRPLPRLPQVIGIATPGTTLQRLLGRAARRAPASDARSRTRP